MSTDDLDQLKAARPAPARIEVVCGVATRGQIQRLAAYVDRWGAYADALTAYAERVTRRLAHAEHDAAQASRYAEGAIEECERVTTALERVTAERDEALALLCAGARPVDEVVASLRASLARPPALPAEEAAPTVAEPTGAAPWLPSSEEEK